MNGGTNHRNLMNKEQIKMSNYGNVINMVMDRVDEMQDKMSPEYEVLRNAIDKDAVAGVDDATYAQTQKDFAEGTAEYETLLAKLESVQVPAKLMGNHKKLTHAFTSFVTGCQQMTASLGAGKTIDVPAFDASEKTQDDASENITKALNRIQFLA